MLDFNNAKEQSKGFSVIPPNSKVLVSLKIEAPASDRRGTYPELCKSQNSSLEYLNAVLEVVAGSFKGKQIFHNFNIYGASTEKQKKAVDISMSQLRALVESACHISPKDNSPQAQRMRVLNSYSELNGKVFPVEVKCSERTSQKSGDNLIVNELKYIVTVEDTDYNALMNGGEVISDSPIPQVTSPNTEQQKPSWVASSSNANTGASANTLQNKAPSWAAPRQQTQNQYAGAMPPPQVYPSENQVDDNPF